MSYITSLYLITTENGGRKNPIFSGYRPNFTFDSEKYYSIVVSLLDKEVLYPGEGCKAKIDFISASFKIDEFEKKLNSKDIFYITEGTKKIGHCTIENI